MSCVPALWARSACSGGRRVARSITPGGRSGLEGVLLRPSRAVLEVLAAAVADGSLRPVVDQVLELADAAVAHRRVESRRGQGKVVLRVAG